MLAYIATSTKQHVSFRAIMIKDLGIVGAGWAVIGADGAGHTALIPPVTEVVYDVVDTAASLARWRPAGAEWSGCVASRGAAFVLTFLSKPS